MSQTKQNYRQQRVRCKNIHTNMRTHHTCPVLAGRGMNRKADFREIQQGIGRASCGREKSMVARTGCGLLSKTDLGCDPSRLTGRDFGKPPDLSASVSLSLR